MCFAPQADLVGGLVVGAIGVDAVRHVDHRPGHVALASVPLVLGAHQVVEAFVWWGLQGKVPQGVGRAALWIYLLIALVILPVYLPLAVFMLERTRSARSRIAPFVGLGAAVAVTYLIGMVRGPIAATLAPYHVEYFFGRSGASGALIATLYVIAVCGSLLLSGHRILIMFGVANLVVLPLILLLTVDGFASLWCAYAALASGVIALYMRLGRRSFPTGEPGTSSLATSPSPLD